MFGGDVEVNDNGLLGAAVSIIKTDLRYKDKTGDKTRNDTTMFSLYGTQKFANNLFVQAIASYSSTKVNNKEHRIVPITTSGYQIAHAKYTSKFFGGELLLGYNTMLSEAVSLTPLVGIRFTHYKDNGYKETGTTYLNKIVKGRKGNKTDGVIGAKLATTINKNDLLIIPEMHAMISRNLGGKAGKIDARLTGMTQPFVIETSKATKTRYNLGLTITAKSGNIEYSAGYDSYLAKKYVGHQGTLKVRVNL